MSATSLVDSIFHGQVRKASQRLLWLGVGMAVLGVVALVFPVVSTLAATLFVGWMLLVSGGFTPAGSFSVHGTGPFFGALLLALLSIAARVCLFFNPAA